MLFGKISILLIQYHTADDTNIFYSHTDASYLMEIVNLELEKITCWFYTNKLSINVKKPNSLSTCSALWDNYAYFLGN